MRADECQRIPWCNEEKLKKYTWKTSCIFTMTNKYYRELVVVPIKKKITIKRNIFFQSKNGVVYKPMFNHLIIQMHNPRLQILWKMTNPRYPFQNWRRLRSCNNDLQINTKNMNSNLLRRICQYTPFSEMWSLRVHLYNLI